MPQQYLELWWQEAAITKCVTTWTIFLVPKWEGTEGERVERRGEKEGRGEEKIGKNTVLNESPTPAFQGLSDSKQLYDQQYQRLTLRYNQPKCPPFTHQQHEVITTSSYSYNKTSLTFFFSATFQSISLIHKIFEVFLFTLPLRKGEVFYIFCTHKSLYTKWCE